MKNKTIPSILFIILFGGISSAQSDHLLWYNRPAEYFEESLVLGNGKMGASVFGGVGTDQIYLNDITLWSGEPVNPNMNPEAYKHLPEIRAALHDENYRLADSLNRKLQGSFSQSYAPLGTLFIHFPHENEADSYYRELDISRAISTVKYDIDGVRYQREYFISHPDQVMVIQLSSSKQGALSFSVDFESLLRYNTTSSESTLEIEGYAPWHAEPNYRGNMPYAMRFDKDRATRFSSLIRVMNCDGNLAVTDSSLEMEGGTKATILVSIATSFNGYDKNPATQGIDQMALALDHLKKASSKSAEALKRAHLDDYRAFFNRVHLSLGETTAPDLPTDERLKRYMTGAEDKNLEILYFQFGRYLLISSSRTDGVPANLQGIWNPHLRPPWSCNYTLNINAEENYWLAGNTNLSEMEQPLLTFIGNIAETGKITARTFYGVSGWSAGHNSDIWAMSNPVGDFGNGDPVWANWNMGGAWLSTHLWEHYLFTCDETYLRNSAYPLMKGAAQFCLEWMIRDDQGYLITSPSTSPENNYLTDTGYRGATFYGGTADLAMIRECLNNVVKAATVLNTDAGFRDTVELALSQLYPYQVGKKGNLQEWYYDWEDADPRHRHQSHLFGLYPGHQITPENTPELAAACRKTLEIKGDETTGWSKGWRINLWARLRDGNRSYKMYRELLKYVEPDGVRTSYARGGGTYPNLFDAHPPFQIDGNFGGAAAVVEMLMQSSENEIRLLPALPGAWADGAVQGICARGGYEISMEWSNMTLSRVNISAKKDGKTTLISGDKQKEIELKAGQVLDIEW